MIEHSELFPLPEAVARTQAYDTHLQSLDWQFIHDMHTAYPTELGGLSMVIGGLKPAWAYDPMHTGLDITPLVPASLSDRLCTTENGWLVDLPNEAAIIRANAQHFPDADVAMLDNPAYLAAYIAQRKTFSDIPPEEHAKTGLLLGIPYRDALRYRASNWNMFHAGFAATGYYFDTDRAGAREFGAWYDAATRVTGMVQLIDRHVERVQGQFRESLADMEWTLDIVEMDGFPYLRNIHPEPHKHRLTQEILPLAAAPYTEETMRHMFGVFERRYVRPVLRLNFDDVEVPKRNGIPFVHLAQTPDRTEYFPKSTDARRLIRWLPKHLRRPVGAYLGAS